MVATRIDGAPSASLPPQPGGLASLPEAESAHSRSGAQATAARYATAIGGEGMFNPSARHALVQSIAHPLYEKTLQDRFDKGFTTEFNGSLGLDLTGQPAAGELFVSRTTPVSTSVTSYADTEATVDVRCTGVLSRTGHNPIALSSKFTMTLRLMWTDGEWRLRETDQHNE
ncbi:hypothetical protein J7E97_16150 [Streptomyces sp. ISL-66]|uniref:hypothetical protein n=1 Tax=Streptomyces sp. ISL-66 TaxID=2819186 RepID=UPI001BE53A53|nr:hypothetical protein [Streptomyces sp. ISL-66]MBT2469366.1 hypothetical protein [Streptomyces sp. ISL-66]